MKKFSMLFVTLTVVGILAVAALAAKDSDSAKVGFTLTKYFSLEVKRGDNVDFGKIDPLKAYSKKNGSTLSVESNTSWTLSTDKKVVRKANGANDKDVLNTLNVKLETNKGKGNDKDIRVDYTLDNLENLPAGDYVIEVTFTGSTK